ncbi:MAG: hypothetical protein IJS56_01525 [Bacilli bacterium]|nr:hypothetical protein [Bacilli bacterium]
MKKNSIILLAEDFGFGPVTTLIEIAKEIKRRDKDIELIFIGPKFCINKIKSEGLCDKYVDIRYMPEEIEKNIDLFKNANKILAVETTDILIYLINNYDLKNIYLVDNLFWMWDFLEEELKKLKRYYISDVISCDENIERIGQGFNNLYKVGMLRHNYNKDIKTDNNLMISLGGAKSYMFNSDLIYKFYLNVINHILSNAKAKEFKTIYITGGSELIDYLKDNLIVLDNVILNTYNHDEYLDKLHSCRYAIMSPGLGNFNEIILSNINTMFLLPINYSQYIQRLKFKKYYDYFDYQINNKESAIEEYLEESIGVNKVIDNLKKYDFSSFDAEIESFFNKNDVNKKIDKDKFDTNGICEIVDDLL